MFQEKNLNQQINVFINVLLSNVCNLLQINWLNYACKMKKCSWILVINKSYFYKSAKIAGKIWFDRRSLFIWEGKTFI